MGNLPFERIEREIFVKQNAKTSTKYGKVPSERTVKELIDLGIVCINKPKGPTSHQVSAYVKKALHLKKTGHSGTLDPRVTGLLPVALGSGTRIVQALLNSGKEYICVMHLHKEIDPEKIKTAMNSFVGKIKQLPPVKSAIKREFRFRKIYYIEIIEIEGQDVLFKVGCQAGTYIRKLCHDMGEKLNMGAHMAELIRTKAGPFNFNEMISMQDLKDAYVFYEENSDETEIRRCIRPIEEAVNHLPKIWTVDSAVGSLCHGSDLKVPGVAKVESDMQIGETAAILTLKDELVAIGEIRMISKDIIKKQKGVAIRVNKVFMMPGVYPKIERD